MSARLPRRSFAAPFVVTLATIPACYVQTSTGTSTGSGPRQPPPASHTQPAAVTPPPVGPQSGPNDQVVVANPPRPTTEPAPPAQPNRPSPANTTPAQPARPADKVVVVANPPRPTTQPAQPPRPSPANTGTAPAAPVRPNDTVISNPPPPTATPERRWTVTRTKGQCKAFIDASSACPSPVKGKPVATCNPPPPTTYACPDFLADGGRITLVRPANEATCTVDYGPIACPKGAICNPPPPRQVSCPK